MTQIRTVINADCLRRKSPTRNSSSVIIRATFSDHEALTFYIWGTDCCRINKVTVYKYWTFSYGQYYIITLGIPLPKTFKASVLVTCSTTHQIIGCGDYTVYNLCNMAPQYKVLSYKYFFRYFYMVLKLSEAVFKLIK